jgi:CBS domain-containing protein
MVAEGGHLRGVFTMNDLMRLRGLSVIGVLEGIDTRTTIDGLAAFRSQVDRITASLVADGALASQITGIITEFNDRITRRVVQLCQDAMGPPPAPYAWLGLGSEGRKEQTLTTDQDNALLLDDRAGAGKEAREYFRRLADKAVYALDRCGFKMCLGRIMANQPKWSGSLDDWRERIQSWVDEPTPRRARDIMTFLDFRGIFGDMGLVETLRRQTIRVFADNPRFLTPVAEDTLSKGPPLGLFKGFIVEKSGEHKGRLNLKAQGTLILIDCLRVLAVRRACSKPTPWRG